jgi:hypothetical protein
MIRKKILSGLFVFCLVQTAHSEILLKDYHNTKQSQQKMFRTYIDGVGMGFSWSNAYLKTTGKPALFCPPDGITLQPDNYIDIIDSAASSSQDQHWPIELVLLYELAKRFPCR